MFFSKSLKKKFELFYIASNRFDQVNMVRIYGEGDGIIVDILFGTQGERAMRETQSAFNLVTVVLF